MSTTIKPIEYSCYETSDYTDNLADNIKKEVGTDADLLLNHPAIYVHVWQSKYDVLNGTFSIYIGETNDIVSRTKEHWYAAKIPKDKRTKGNWQYHMKADKDQNGKSVVPKVYFFGHKLFHKSLTLDIENRLIDYCYSMPTAHIYNGRTNPQGNYSGDENFDTIFSMIWKSLRNDNPELFLSEAYIQKSAIYKTSPNHRLTDEQKKAKACIIDRTVDAVLKNKKGQLIFVEGDAGTGKTVLTSSTFYELLETDVFKEMALKCYLLINHNEQMLVYKNMARKLGYEDDIVQNPTGFLLNTSILNNKTNKYEPDMDKIADIVFIDEAHLLWYQRTQKFTNQFELPQIEEIMKRARVTVVMYDENQVLHRRQICADGYMNSLRGLAQRQGPDPRKGDSNYILLKNQLRMNCDSQTMNWLDEITKNKKVSSLKLDKKNKDSKGYEVLIFDSPEDMHNAIKSKASHTDTHLSRILSTYDWRYKNSGGGPAWRVKWEITIGSWSIPWNEEIFWRDMVEAETLSKREIKQYKALSWAEKDYSIDEAGNTYVIQGFDLAYAGVILGPSVKYDEEKGEIYFDEAYRPQPDMHGYTTFPDGKKINFTEIVSKHELRVLLSRGTKGLYIYACDDKLRAVLNESIIH